MRSPAWWRRSFRMLAMAKTPGFSSLRLIARSGALSRAPCVEQKVCAVFPWGQLTGDETTLGPHSAPPPGQILHPVMADALELSPEVSRLSIRKVRGRFQAAATSVLSRSAHWKKGLGGPCNPIAPHGSSFAELIASRLGASRSRGRGVHQARCRPSAYPAGCRPIAPSWQCRVCCFHLAAWSSSMLDGVVDLQA